MNRHEPKSCIAQVLKTLYGETVVVKRFDHSWVVTGDLTEENAKEVLIIGEQYTVGIDIEDIWQISVTVGFHPIVMLKEVC